MLFYADDVYVSVSSLDEDDEAERNTVPLTPLDSLFSDTDSLKPQKKKKAKKMKEGKMPKVKKRKKEVRLNSQSTTTCVDPGHLAVAGSSVSLIATVNCGHRDLVCRIDSSMWRWR